MRPLPLLLLLVLSGPAASWTSGRPREEGERGTEERGEEEKVEEGRNEEERGEEERREEERGEGDRGEDGERGEEGRSVEERGEEKRGEEGWGEEGERSGEQSNPTCAYKVVSRGRGRGRERLCFRSREPAFRCGSGRCRRYRSGRSLVANVLANGSVLLQWWGWGSGGSGWGSGGFRLNCSWGGLYTRFQCDSVRLGAACRDYLLPSVHDSVDYRVCLHTLHTNGSLRDTDCLHFRAQAAGMQDIVIAMTAVGGSICVMLVVICLLVAYITENIMHPALPRSAGKRGHSDHRAPP
ncbi:fibronectin type III domain-containing protein 10 [Rhinoraja longicauda]